MRAGKLRERIQFQARSTVQDTLGQQLTSWAPVPNTPGWAEFRTLSVAERQAAQSKHSEITHEVTVRYASVLSDPRVVAAWRILYGSRVFEIHGCND
jgi:SPP1 family predicted phage head-tail adaptor